MPERKELDFANVEKTMNYLTAEEFPEGPYGAPFHEDEPVQNKSSEWREGQRFYSAFNYENKTLHEGMQRKIDPSHPPHDDKNRSEQPPYTGTGNS
ncbi:cytosolic protein [Peribacillus sp. SCS-37]|uniref:cytosolic protein n=1 Tax=Paraperibacillus esterisolvens TaxID=3115296 RepID=UPI0039060FDF